MDEALQLPEEMRRAFMKALMNLDSYSSKACKVRDVALQPHECAMCCAAYATINFIDEYLLLGLKPHNRPLFVSGYAKEQKVGRMLVDGSSAINLMPKPTMT